jgi:hypothetical protein
MHAATTMQSAQSTQQCSADCADRNKCSNCFDFRFSGAPVVLRMMGVSRASATTGLARQLQENRLRTACEVLNL